MAATTPTTTASVWEEEREAKIKALLGEMTEQEKIMQVGQVDKAYIKDLNDIAEYGIGSIISGGSGQVRACVHVWVGLPSTFAWQGVKEHPCV
jgi:hypothetical protein